MHYQWESEMFRKIALLSRAEKLAWGLLLILITAAFLYGLTARIPMAIDILSGRKEKREIHHLKRKYEKGMLIGIIFFLILPLGISAEETGVYEKEDCADPELFVEYKAVSEMENGERLLNSKSLIIIGIREENLSYEDVEIDITDESGNADRPDGWDIGPWRQEGDMHQCEIIFLREGDFGIKISGHDEYGNALTGEEVVNGIYEKSGLIFDQTPPLISEVLCNGSRLEDNEMTDQMPKLTVRVKEKHFEEKEVHFRDSLFYAGQKKAEVTLTEEDYKLRWRNIGEENSIPVYETEFQIEREAIHKISFQIRDRAGQECSYQKKLVYDRTGPEIIYSIAEGDSGDIILRQDKDRKAAKPLFIRHKDYSYFSREKIYLQVTLRDEVSGVSGVEYEFCDKEEQGKKETVQTAVSNLAEWSVWLWPEQNDFKGFVSVLGIDCCGNRSQVVKSAGMISESDDSHETSSRIVLKATKPTGKDLSGHEIYYRKNFTIEGTFTDTVSGLKEIELALEKKGGGKLLSKKYRMPQNDHNIILKKRLTLRVALDELSGIDGQQLAIVGYLTDNAGHTDTKTIQNSVVVADTKKPVINVRYESQDENGSKYFQKVRTAIINVEETNFDPDLVQWKIQGNRDGYSIDSWIKTGSVNQCQVHFLKDGDDYNLGLTVRDKAGNETIWHDEETFTIDQTLPLVKVEIPGRAAVHEKYYSEPKRLVFSLKEAHPDPKQTRMEVRLRNGKKKKMIPLQKSNLDSFFYAKCQEDGEYEISFSCKDLAGNQSVFQGQRKFVIDTRQPQISESSLRAGKTYHKHFVPALDCTDKNLDTSSLHATIRRMDRKAEKMLPSSTEKIEEGYRFRWDSFSDEKNADGVYELVLTGKDLAGNSIKKGNHILFRVNRNGAVFQWDDARSIAENGSYLKEDQEIRFRMYSVNRMHLQIVMIRNREERIELSRDQYRIRRRTVRDESGPYRFWQETVCVLPRELFGEDGEYRILIHSQEYDRSDNGRQMMVTTDNEIRKCPIIFVADQTPPAVYMDGLEQTVYSKNRNLFRVTATDNTVLKKVRITVKQGLLNPKKEVTILEKKDFDEMHTATVALPKGQGMMYVRYEAWDEAGNKTDSDINGDSGKCMVLPIVKSESQKAGALGDGVVIAPSWAVAGLAAVCAALLWKVGRYHGKRFSNRRSDQDEEETSLWS